MSIASADHDLNTGLKTVSCDLLANVVTPGNWLFDVRLHDVAFDRGTGGLLAQYYRTQMCADTIV
jgi:hypothetical protein